MRARGFLGGSLEAEATENKTGKISEDPARAVRSAPKHSIGPYRPTLGWLTRSRNSPLSIHGVPGNWFGRVWRVQSQLHFSSAKCVILPSPESSAEAKVKFSTSLIYSGSALFNHIHSCLPSLSQECPEQLQGADSAELPKSLRTDGTRVRPIDQHKPRTAPQAA